VGERAARALFARFPGRWEVRQLAANAGISTEPGVLDERGGLDKFDRAVWDAVLGVNLNGVFYGIKAFLAALV
jgi:NAD(P)-dependent dehydrogenase (short-subunit alcohol dehydrogenase family)